MPYTIAYARVSTEQQAGDQQGLEQQLEVLRLAGYDELFQEIVSGRSASRPQFTALVDRAVKLAGEGLKVEILVVEISRFARNAVVSLTTIEKLASLGITLREVAGGQMQIRSADDWLAFVNRSVYSEYFSRQLSDRVRRGMDHKRRNKMPLNHKGLFGYRLSADKSRLEPHPEQWHIARAIVDRLLQGETLSATSKWLHEAHGIHRSVTPLRRWLDRPALLGHLVYGTSNGRNAWGSEVIYDTHPPLLTASELRQIKDSVSERSILWGRNRTGRIYAVPSLCVCATCGYKMSSGVPRPNARYFICRRTDCPIRRQIRDSAVEAAIQNAIAEAAEMAAAALLQGETMDPRIAAWEAEILALEPLAHRSGIAAEIEAIRREISQAKAASEKQAAGDEDFWELVQVLTSFTPRDWAQHSAQSRRQWYLSLVEKVFVQDGEVIDVKLKL